MRNQKITNRDRLGHILDALSAIEEFVGSSSKSSFLNDKKTIDATLFQFAVIGEAICHIDEEILEKYDFPGTKSERLGILFCMNITPLKTL